METFLFIGMVIAGLCAVGSLIVAYVTSKKADAAEAERKMTQPFWAGMYTVTSNYLPYITRGYYTNTENRMSIELLDPIHEECFFTVNLRPRTLPNAESTPAEPEYRSIIIDVQKQSELLFPVGEHERIQSLLFYNDRRIQINLVNRSTGKLTRIEILQIENLPS